MPPMALAYPTAIDRRQAPVAITNSMGTMRLAFGGIYSNAVIAPVVAPPYLTQIGRLRDPWM